MSESYFRRRVRRTGGLSLREDLGIAVATVAIALVTLDRQTAGVKAIDAIGYGLGAAVLWQLARWAVRFLFTAPREMHAEALAERDQARGRAAQLEARPLVTADHWMAMSREFSAVPDRSVQAIWRKGDSWSLSGREPAEVALMLALCTRAGAMLLNSRRVAPKLSATVMARSDHSQRWLQFVRESGAVLTMASDRQSGSFERLATVCSRVCIDCGTAEL